MFLTEDELKELTGWMRPGKIKQWLDQNGYRYETSRDGWPRVLRDVVWARLGAPQRKEPRLNLA